MCRVGCALGTNASIYCEEGRLSFEHVEKYRMLRHLIEFSSI